jgi:hypothetical protein
VVQAKRDEWNVPAGSPIDVTIYAHGGLVDDQGAGESHAGTRYVQIHRPDHSTADPRNLEHRIAPSSPATAATAHCNIDDDAKTQGVPCRHTFKVGRFLCRNEREW